MFGRGGRPEAVRLPYSDFAKPGVRFVHETVTTAIDPGEEAGQHRRRRSTRRTSSSLRSAPTTTTWTATPGPPRAETSSTRWPARSECGMSSPRFTEGRAVDRRLRLPPSSACRRRARQPFFFTRTSPSEASGTPARWSTATPRNQAEEVVKVAAQEAVGPTTRRAVSGPGLGTPTANASSPATSYLPNERTFRALQQCTTACGALPLWTTSKSGGRQHQDARSQRRPGVSGVVRRESVPAPALPTESVSLCRYDRRTPWPSRGLLGGRGSRGADRVAVSWEKDP